MIPTLLGLAGLCLALPQAPTAAAAPRADALERVVVLGASMSGGFLAPSLDRVLAACLRRPLERPILGLGDPMFFTSPRSVGARQVEVALDGAPTLAIAVDYLFWFGYGSIGPRGVPITAESQRLELLEEGLSLLSELECPLVLGDFPDMSGAIGKMLSPEQVPAASTLPLLSRRVREWAAKRPHTVVLPLAEIQASLGSEQEIHIGRNTFPPGSHLLQSDGLHPTTEGMAAIGQLLVDELVDAGLIEAAAAEPQLESVLAKLRRSAVLGTAGSGTER